MATAISFVSESGDHYLDLFEGKETIDEIVGILKEKYSDEFQYLYIQNCLSSNHSVKELKEKVFGAIEEDYEDE